MCSAFYMDMFCFEIKVFSIKLSFHVGLFYIFNPSEFTNSLTMSPKKVFLFTIMFYSNITQESIVPFQYFMSTRSWP